MVFPKKRPSHEGSMNLLVFPNLYILNMISLWYLSVFWRWQVCEATNGLGLIAYFQHFQFGKPLEPINSNPWCRTNVKKRDLVLGRFSSLKLCEAVQPFGFPCLDLVFYMYTVYMCWPKPCSVEHFFMFKDKNKKLCSKSVMSAKIRDDHVWWLKR